MRKSVGAQIRSVFNVTDPFSREFSDDSGDETLDDRSVTNQNSTQDSESSVNYLTQWSAQKESTSLFVHCQSHLNNTVETNQTAAENIKRKNKFNYENVKTNNSRANTSSIKIKLNSTPKQLNRTSDLSKTIFQNIFSQKLVTLNQSDADILALDTPDEESQEIVFGDDTQIVMDSDISLFSNAEDG